MKHRPATSAHAARAAAAGALFLDWCTATGIDPHSATVDTIKAFDTAVPAAGRTRAARTAATHRLLESMGPTLPAPERHVETAWRIGPDWLTLPDALRRIPFAGWPGGFRGRRDASLLVLLHSGLTRTQALTTTTRDITVNGDGVTIRGQVVESVDDLEACPACAVTRWLRIASLENMWGRGSVRADLITASTPTEHDCADPLPAKWREVWHLLPAIDRYGWTTNWRPMTTRAVSAVAAYRQLAASPFDSKFTAVVVVVSEQLTQEPDAAASEDPARLSEADLDDLFDVLDERIDAADEILRRINAQLAHDAAAVSKRQCT